MFKRLFNRPVWPRQRWRLALALALLLAIGTWSCIEITTHLDSYPLERLKRRAHSSLQLTDRHGALLRELPGRKSRFASWVPLEQISTHLINATLISEDKRFLEHDGVDAWAIMRAARDNLSRRRVVSGASTITMQLVRLLSPRKRGWRAKVIEAFEARRLERRLNKTAILEQYLNRAPYGHGTIGIEAASRLYFGKPSSELSVAEGALLAVIPRSPNRFSPYKHLSRLRPKQRELLRRMFLAGAINATQWVAALDEKLMLSDGKQPFLAPHFTRMLRLRLAPARGRHNIQKVITTLDLQLQTRVERIINDHLKPLGKHSVSNAAVVILDNKSGDVLSWVGSRKFFDKKNNGQVDGVLALRQPGSTLKPFAYALAFERGYTPATIVADIETRYRLADGRHFRPRNYDNRYYGPKRLRSALASSLNISALKVTRWVGEAVLLQRLRRLGFGHFTKAAPHYGLGLVLGNGEVTLLELATAFSALARGGTQIAPRFWLERYNADNKRLREPRRRIRRIFGERVTFLVNHILSDPMARIQGFGFRTPFNFPFKVAVKTGTSNNWRDNWTVGYTPQVTVAVWVGNFNGKPMHNVSGVSGAGPIFRHVMRAAMKNRPKLRFSTAKKMIKMRICPLSGRQPGPSCPHQTDEYFIPGTEPAESCHFHRHVRIDLRNGLLAANNCPEKFSRLRSMVTYPPEYANWVRQRNVRHAPTHFSPLCPSPKRVAKKAPTIVSPNDGGRYLIDPSQPLTWQSLPLKAVVPGPVSRVTWFIDGKPYKKVGWPFTAHWPLSKGKHTLSVVANGRKSPEIQISVR